jgi:hypothetical protein
MDRCSARQHAASRSRCLTDSSPPPHPAAGSFETEEKAARAHDLALLKLHGPGLTTNFPAHEYRTGLDELKALSAAQFLLAMKKYAQLGEQHFRQAGQQQQAAGSAGAGAAAAAAGVPGMGAADGYQQDGSSFRASGQHAFDVKQGQGQQGQDIQGHGQSGIGGGYGGMQSSGMQGGGRPAKRRLVRRLQPGEYADESCMFVDESGNQYMVMEAEEVQQGGGQQGRGRVYGSAAAGGLYGSQQY